MLSEEVVSTGERGGGIPYLDALDWREQQTAFRGIAAFTQGTVNVADEGNPPERFNGAFVTANRFEQVDGVPIMGRVFNASEDAGTAEPTIILGYDVRQNRYADDPDIVGRSIRANGRQTTVGGVMPEGLHFPFQEDVWLPIGIDPLQSLRGTDRVVALSCALLVSAGMMVKSVIHLQALDLGFDDSQVFTARVGLFAADYPDDEAARRFYDRLVEDLRAEPGVSAAALTTSPPATGAGLGRIGLEGAVYEVEPSDPLVYASIVLTLGLAGLLACLVPARRATRIQLVDALRPD